MRQIVLGKFETACSKPEQLFSKQESSLLPAIPHSKNHMLSNSESIQSYHSNISKAKHCDPGKFVSLTLSSIYTVASFGNRLFAGASAPLPPT